MTTSPFRARPDSTNRAGRAFAGLLVLLVLVPLSTPSGAAASTHVVAQLPAPRMSTAAVWDGSVAYVFGGSESNVPKADVYRFNPDTYSVTTVRQLPSAICCMSAVWDGTNAYLFGGLKDAVCCTDEIVRYHPSVGTPGVVARLPVAQEGSAAVWDGRDRPAAGCPGGCAYIFGGWTGTTMLDRIVRFNPSTGDVDVMAARLPDAGGVSMAAAWTGQVAYLLGGCVPPDCVGHPTDRILRYDPVTDTITNTGSRLPTKAESPSAASRGSYVYVFGGIDQAAGTLSNQVVRYDAAQNDVSVLPATLPSARYATSAVAADCNGAFVFGGQSTSWWAPSLRDVVHLSEDSDGPVGSPRDLRAWPGHQGQIKLSWKPTPLCEGGAVVTKYFVYREGERVGETTGLSFDDNGLEPDAEYCYQVSASFSSSEGPKSNWACARAGLGGGGGTPNCLESLLDLLQCVREKPPAYAIY